MRSPAHSDGHDAPGLGDDPVPSVATVVEDVGIGSKDAVSEPVVPHELPEVLDRVEFGRAGREGHQGDVVRHGQLPGGVPAGLIEEEHGVGTGRHGRRDLFEVVGYG